MITSQFNHARPNVHERSPTKSTGPLETNVDIFFKLLQISL